MNGKGDCVHQLLVIIQVTLLLQKYGSRSESCWVLKEVELLHRIQNVEEWVRGWAGEELLHPRAPDAQSTRRSQVLHVVEWHWGYGHGLLWLAQPRCLLLCTILMAQYLSVTVLPASPTQSHGIGGPQGHWGRARHPEGTAGRAAPAGPCPPLSSLWAEERLESRGLDCCEGPCHYLSICMDVIDSERRRKKPTKQVLEKSSSNNTCCRNGFQRDTNGLSFHFCNGSELLH